MDPGRVIWKEFGSEIPDGPELSDAEGFLVGNFKWNLDG